MGRPVDVFAMGVILYCLVHGVPPFTCALDKHHRFMMRRQAKDKNLGRKLRSIDDLICGMLEPGVSKRLTLTQIMSHEWLNDF